MVLAPACALSACWRILEYSSRLTPLGPRHVGWGPADPGNAVVPALLFAITGRSARLLGYSAPALDTPDHAGGRPAAESLALARIPQKHKQLRRAISVGTGFDTIFGTGFRGKTRGLQSQN